MAQGDEGARGARVERGAVRTGRCAAGLALLWFWVPWAAAIAHPLEQGALLAPLLATALFFGACACAALAALRLAKRVGTGYARMGDVLAASAGSLGSVIALLAYAAGEASLALQVLAMLLSGFAMGLAIVRWERSVAGVSERGMVGCAAALLASWSALLYVLFAGGGSGASLAGLAGVVSLAVRPRALRPDAQDVVVTRLLTLQTASFLKRYAGAFAASGAVTTFALIQFASARFAVVSDDTFLVLLLVAPVFLLVLLCAWLLKREQNFMLVFHLSFVVALLVLFPVNPGTPISLNVSVAFCLLWIGSLVGSLLVMGSRVNRALRPWCDPCGLGPAAFCLGVAAGALVAIGWTMTPDFETVASGSPDGIVKVSVVTSFALIVLFCATNVVLRGSMLRRVELIARGRITQVMPAPRSFSGSEAHGEGDAPDALQDAYRRIAFDRGLTPRELDVLVVLGRGNTLARVQSELVISEGTAITHRRNIYRKLDVHSKQELLDFVERYARA